MKPFPPRPTVYWEGFQGWEWGLKHFYNKTCLVYTFTTSSLLPWWGFPLIRPRYYFYFLFSRGEEEEKRDRLWSTGLILSKMIWVWKYRQPGVILSIDSDNLRPTSAPENKVWFSTVSHFRLRNLFYIWRFSSLLYYYCLAERLGNRKIKWKLMTVRFSQNVE